MTQKIYLDNNATTLLDPDVLKVMVEDLSSPPSNPSSVHFFGRDAKAKLLKARQTIAHFCKVKTNEIFFTSSGTESMNWLIRGLVNPSLKPHILTSNVEHSCVEKTLLDLESQGAQVSFLPAGLAGAPSYLDIEKAILPETKLLVFSAANGETGVKQDIAKLAALALEKKIPLVLDGVAWFGKEPFLIYPGITAVGFSAHKFHGPKGVGFVFLKDKTSIKPLLTGGGQELGLRSSTENITGILGLSEAVDLLKENLEKSHAHMQFLRDHFEKMLIEKMPFIKINGSSPRICNVSNLCFEGVDAETLLIQLDLHYIAASQGSACSSGALEPSRILTQMGLSTLLARSSVRFSFSRFNTIEEVDKVIQVLSHLIPKLRS